MAVPLLRASSRSRADAPAGEQTARLLPPAQNR